jgi:hypothetical protein
MRKPRTLTLLVAGVVLYASASLFVVPTTRLRLVRGPGGEVIRRPDGGALFERDTLAQFKQDWLPNLMLAAGVFFLGWSAFRGALFLYDRGHNKVR